MANFSIQILYKFTQQILHDLMIGKRVPGSILDCNNIVNFSPTPQRVGKGEGWQQKVFQKVLCFYKNYFYKNQLAEKLKKCNKLK